MTDMRDHLADIVEAAIDSVHDLDVTHRDYAEASADAIIAAIKPLEWERPAMMHESVTMEEAAFLGVIYQAWGGGAVTVGNDHHIGNWGRTLEAAKYAAESLKIAQIMAAFGIAQGGE